MSIRTRARESGDDENMHEERGDVSPELHWQRERGGARGKCARGGELRATRREGSVHFCGVVGVAPSGQSEEINRLSISLDLFKRR